ncbi:MULTISPECIES: conjugal transfer protein TrbF [Prosthecochloris]|uniref:Type IV secretion system protein n=1 Tax=Prosthecochloris vibrioformis TaxID=1098 RepID=A0A5C4S4G2_PROVB|nr:MULTISPECIES: conjugal transfer protein TrbF [Prosthecochloris]ANT65592.1 conjugal transfer protein TrbF [Prosthecochloris sp. CIB 2401]TNJ38027.1 type IV secretion system protein [Prosthecochloris vibrioformis]
MAIEATEKNWRPEGEVETPYKRARKEWDDRIGSSVIQAKNWRLATFATLFFVAFPSLLGMIYMGAQPKAVPHIVEVMPDGHVAYRGVAGKDWGAYTPSEASVKYHLSRFVNNTRMISSDKGVIKRNWLDAYNLLSSRAAKSLNDYARQRDPFLRSETERVGVQISSMVQISEQSWQIDWEETRRGKRGDLLGSESWRGIFRIIMQQPETEHMLAANPIGLFIDEFHWSKIQR